ncbi:PKD domain-containing protein [Danxiaibacter flavus]|uniref:PKD domain-containing protein n=1 Tax=Danxiaibacter flavus TaxID=3049108 RepID=A0ABV3ZQ75_9BACT|nr:PKD domain-containing protein [Chitinophagaceae bacterium DXS]
MKLLTHIVVFISLLTSAKSIGQSIEFVENKGQWDKSVKYKGNLNGGAFYLTSTGYRVVLTNPDDMRKLAEYYHGGFSSDSSFQTARASAVANNKLSLRAHAYEVKFVNASQNIFCEPDKPLTSVNNYFIGNDSTKWAKNCKIYQAVTYRNIYPNVDLRYYMDNDALKYDLVVNPGGDINKIALQFDGVNRIDIKNQNLVVSTSVGEVAELKPYTYQSSVNGRAEINSKYVIINNNTVTFRIENYDRTKPLIIDPTLVFSTFSGSRDDNWGYTATYDGGGNFYGAGIVFGTGWPVSNGSFETTFGGGVQEDNLGPLDIGIIKLSPNGTQRVYATYLGGAGNEQPHSLIVDNKGELVAVGRTSSKDFPTSVALYGSGGASDIFITKFTADGGSIVGSRLFGGSGPDGVNISPKYADAVKGASSTRRNYGDDARSEVIVDAQNNIYLASCTQSKDFPITSNAFQKTFGGGMQDGVFIKTSADLSTVITSTYFGGSDNDAAFVLALSPITNNILVGGATGSSDFPGVGSVGINTAYQGGECDGFVSLLSNDGHTLIRTTYAGTGGNDLVYGVQFDKFGYPYIMGSTTGTWPVVNAAFSQPNGRQFISKLKQDLSGFEYSTVFGKGQAEPDISPVAFLVDRCENVYVSGWGGSTDKNMGYPTAYTNGLSITPDAIQKTTDGSDFYFFVLQKDAVAQLYGSYFGQQGGFGDHVDGGTSRFDKQGVIYNAICANCNKQGIFPTMPGNVWSPSNPSNSGARCNLAMVKVAFELAGIASGIQSSIDGVPRDTAGCVPLKVDFKDTIGIAKQYIWNFGDGSASVTTTTPQTSHTYQKLGLFNVMLIAIDSSACNIADTSYLNILVRKDRAIISAQAIKLPPCDSLRFEFQNNSTSPAGVPFDNHSFIWDFGDGSPTITTGTQSVFHSYASPGKYTISLQMIDTAFCNYPETDSIPLRIAANVKAQFVTPPSGCAPYDAVFTNTSMAGQQYLWDFGDGAVSTEEDPVHTYFKPGEYTVKLKVTDSSTCNIVDSTQYHIIVSPKPTAMFTYSPLQPQANTPFVFTNSSENANSYKWLFGDDDSLITIKKDPLSYVFPRSGNFRVILIAINQYGCADTTSATLQAIVEPLVDVPNAFTPNGDGSNDIVRVRGYGIEKMSWKIFNRWGTLVFQSASSTIGWDGKYKGQLQPQDVYTYILDVIFSDGTKAQKRGDITLLR